MLPNGRQSIIQTHLHTFQALITASPVDLPANGLAQCNGPGGADLCTMAAGNALDVAHHQLGQGDLGFRIRTPGTFQWTALHEHGGPDSRPVMNAETLDVENNTRVVSTILHFINK